MLFDSFFKLAMALVLMAMVVLSGCMVSPAAPAAEKEPAIAVQAATQAELEAQVREAIWAWEDAYQAGDLDRLMDIYAEDAVSMPPNRPILEGKSAMEEDFRLFFEEFTVERQFSLIDIEISGDTAVRRGEWTQTFSPKAGGEPITEVGKCLMVFKRFGDEWKAVAEIWNLDE
jgi:ketosteroid isomerase-like protein